MESLFFAFIGGQERPPPPPLNPSLDNACKIRYSTRFIGSAVFIPAYPISSELVYRFIQCYIFTYTLKLFSTGKQVALYLYLRVYPFQRWYICSTSLLSSFRNLDSRINNKCVFESTVPHTDTPAELDYVSSTPCRTVAILALLQKTACQTHQSLNSPP